MGDKYLSDVIDYERDIKKHNFIAIYSGVGSGKSRFIDSFYRMDPEIHNPQMTVLVITSRRAKVDEILANQTEAAEKSETENDVEALDEKDVTTYIRGKIGHWGNIHRVPKEETIEEFKEKNKKYLRVIERGDQKHFVYQQSAVCTNAFIEKYIQNVYDPQDVTTHLWELFDMIVVDEAHSLILDASYQTAPFYVNDLIKEYLWRCEQGKEDIRLYPKCKHLILMTGTPEHIKELGVVWKHDLHIIDKREECINVMPKNIYFIQKSAVQNQLAKKLKEEERSIYFAQTITRIIKYYDNFELEDKSMIAVSFSKEEKRKAVNEEVKKVMEATEKRIKEEGLLPDTVQLLLSTERIKEGINIYNKDIKNIYVESKHLGDIIQMAGRVRDGAENMYVVLDGGLDTEDVIKSYDARFSFIKLVGDNIGEKVLSDFWQKVCQEHDSDLFNNRNSSKKISDAEWSERFIEFVHDQFSYIRYSYFRNCFEFYENKYNGKWDYGTANQKWSNALENDNITHLFEISFPKSKVHPCDINFKKKNKINPACIERAKKYISDNMVIGEKYSANEVDQFIKDLNKILGKEYARIDLIFRCMKVNYQMKAVSKNGKPIRNAIKDNERDKKIFLFSEKIL